MKSIAKHISADTLSTLTKRVFREESGLLTLEWTFLLGILVVGIVGGIAVIRDAITVQYANTAGALGAVDFSYKIEPFTCGDADSPTIQVNGSSFTDDVAHTEIEPGTMKTQ